MIKNSIFQAKISVIEKAMHWADNSPYTEFMICTDLNKKSWEKGNMNEISW